MINPVGKTCLSGLRRCALVCSALLLGACATLPPPPAASVQGPIEHVVTGRLSVRYADPANSRQEQLHGRFDWIERGEAIELTLTDPLGQAVARVLSDVRETSITLRSGETYSGATPEALTTRTLGWPLPLKGMRQWLRGQAGSGAFAGPGPEVVLRIALDAVPDAAPAATQTPTRAP